MFITWSYQSVECSWLDKLSTIWTFNLKWFLNFLKRFCFLNTDPCIFPSGSPFIVIISQSVFVHFIYLSSNCDVYFLFQLYDIGVETRPKESGPIKFVAFKAVHGYGHKHIHKAPELAEIVS